ncbi:MarR family winged helix-turn-helix transcriptional regulator [Subtercola sp. YIM 133946]|uniref:MarR family winged helix-turn-helix transcriptional regulator n=1 Tax=Subtercola sp. YIM 133946 TaxID=3118909 RepID=UPI002F92F649
MTSEPPQTSPSGDPPREAVTLLYLIKQVELAIRARLESVTREAGLTVTQYTALTVLERRPGLTSAELAKNSFVRAQSMSAVTAELLEHGMVTRMRDPSHHRRQLLTVSSTGRDLLVRLRPAVASIEQQMVSALAADDVPDLRRTLHLCRFALAGDAPP